MNPEVFVHSQGICESNVVGAGTRVWAFAHVLPGARIGADCNICDHVFIENDVVLGDRVTIKCGVQLWDGVELGDDVFVGPNATFTNDPFPRSKQYPDDFSRTVVEAGVSIGANATLLPGVRIGRGAMVGAGSVVIGNVPPNAIVVGNPARITGYVNTAEAPALDESASESVSVSVRTGKREALSVGGCELWRLPSFSDLRGNLMALEAQKDLPFEPVRYFFIHAVASEKVRGEHAHHACDQFLTAVNGGVSVVADDGTRRVEVRLDSPDTGLFLPRMVWGIQYKFTADAVLAVFASRPYEADDYIRDYSAFLEVVRKDQRQ